MKAQHLSGLAAAVAALLFLLLPRAPAQAPAGLSASDWTSVRAAYEVNRHAAFAVEGGFQARNRGQQWLTRFDGRGFTVEPDSGGWTWGLELRSYGVGDNAHVVARPLRTNAEGQRVAYAWDDALEEWYVNDGRGLEHGYTVRARPAGAEGVPLAFTLAVRGGLEPGVHADGRGVAFLNADGAAVVNYSGLIVRDASGRDLPARFERAAEGLRLVVDDAGATYPMTIDPLAQQAYLKASNTEADDRFGCAVSVSGDTAVIGAYREDSNATGVNGSQGNNGATDSGAAYVFVRSGTTWSQQAYLKASNTEADDRFGYAVALSGDTVVVGAYCEDSNATGVDGNQGSNGATNSGAAYVFVRNGTTWSQQAYLKASNTDASDFFGRALAVSGDTVVVGADGEDSNAKGVNGDQSDDSATGAGAAYVFTRAGTVWSQQAYLKASNTSAADGFGCSLSIAEDSLVVGAYAEDSVVVISGAAYVFVRNGATWSQQAMLKASYLDHSDEFGFSVALSGDILVVGAFHEDSNATGVNGDESNDNAKDSGAAFVFVRSGATWAQQAYLKASNTDAGDYFGYAVAVSGEVVVVGALGEDSSATGVNGDEGDNSAVESGAAYMYQRIGGIWRQRAYLKASNAEMSDRFGGACSVSGETVVAGAVGEASNATGVDGDQGDNSAAQAGAAYVFVVPCGPISTYGAGCPGSGGFVPEFSMSGCATPGEYLEFHISHGLGGSLAWLFVGGLQTSLPMGGSCTLNVWPAIGPLGPLPLSGAGAGNGTISSVVAIPLGSPLGTITVQAFVVDSGALLGFSNSNGVSLTIE